MAAVSADISFTPLHSHLELQKTPRRGRQSAASGKGHFTAVHGVTEGGEDTKNVIEHKEFLHYTLLYLAIYYVAT